MGGGVKGILRSKTVWAGIVAIAVNALSLSGFQIGPEDQDFIAEGLVTVVNLICGGVAIFGRVKATKILKIGGGK